MTNDSKWLIMTYYCPTHGSLDRSEPIQITSNDLKRVNIKYDINNKNKD